MDNIWVLVGLYTLIAIGVMAILIGLEKQDMLGGDTKPEFIYGMGIFWIIFVPILILILPVFVIEKLIEK